MSDTSRLVEQARKGADKYERAAWFEVSDLLTKLADEVERLQANAVNLRRAWREDSDGQHETNRLLAAERDDARARVAALEAGIRNHSCGISRGCTCPGGDHHDEQNTMCRYGQPFDKELELRALLDAGQTCPHGDPTCPCPDGDLCHHEDGPGSPGWPKPVVGDDKADSEEGEQRERMGINHVKG